MITRRDFVPGLAGAVGGLASGIAALGVGATAAHAGSLAVDVAKTATCGCCSAWVNHMKSAGFAVNATDMAMGQLIKFKQKHGISAELSSCHTARVDGYTIEGHVPARDVRRLLTERPDAVGLAVPGMPIGSPGMEAGRQREAYDVLLVLHDGSTRVFSRYGEVR